MWKYGKEPNEINNCFYCKYKWECYDTLFKGKTKPCNNPKEQQKNYKWWELTGESVKAREEARKSYIWLSENINKKN